MSDQAFEFISEVSPFSELPKEELKNYARRIWIEKRSKGTLLYTQGKTDVEHLIIVNSGSLEAYHEIGGKKSFSVFLHRKDLFGGVSMLMNAGISFRTLAVEKDSNLLCHAQENLFGYLQSP
jgi:CBS domain-containing protein